MGQKGQGMEGVMCPSVSNIDDAPIRPPVA